MARSEFDSDAEREEMFALIGRRNKVGRKHNHVARGRAKERRRQGLLTGAAVHEARRKKKSDRFHAEVSAYWRGERDTYPNFP